VTGQDFIKKVNRPKNPVNDQPEDRMVIIPADQHGIDAE
jgi:hypothetical protein